MTLACQDDMEDYGARRLARPLSWTYKAIWTIIHLKYTLGLLCAKPMWIKAESSYWHKWCYGAPRSAMGGSPKTWLAHAARYLTHGHSD